ncbi:hypothetical protein HALO32_00707 [Halomonas lysinitropha]|uniref:Uncharacterized protein n=1 Tax=Halomonas lysinitropha TaxID=2607506 RepID=A0A5K1I6B1_9GAMM|nr:hypothetical protein HALO32_00707 [Halomonas lysinitropha]
MAGPEDMDVEKPFIGQLVGQGWTSWPDYEQIKS